MELKNTSSKFCERGGVYDELLGVLKPNANSDFSGWNRCCGTKIEAMALSASGSVLILQRVATPKGDYVPIIFS